MGKGGKLAEEARALCAPVIDRLKEQKIALLDVDFVSEGGQKTLRIIIDKRGGVSFDDCTAVTRAVEPVLDATFSWQGHYQLEVSSPGFDYAFKREEDLRRHIGESVDITLYRARDGVKRFAGELLEAKDGVIGIRRAAAPPPKGRRVKKTEAAETRLTFAINDCAKIKRRLDC